MRLLLAQGEEPVWKVAPYAAGGWPLASALERRAPWEQETLSRPC